MHQRSKKSKRGTDLPKPAEAEAARCVIREQAARVLHAARYRLPLHAGRAGELGLGPDRLGGVVRGAAAERAPAVEVVLHVDAARVAEARGDGLPGALDLLGRRLVGVGALRADAQLAILVAAPAEAQAEAAGGG